jgi:5-bromo-4-chloroindolyl phosphate hydrolysis protein
MIYHQINYSAVQKVRDLWDKYTELNKKKKRSRNTLLILDDVTAYLKDNPKALIELATNRRHLKLSIILLVQFIRSVPRPVRFQVTDVCFFKPSFLI